MKRDIYRTLLDWKNDDSKRPLLLRGARQVGKSFIINQFGSAEFDHMVVLNFEREPRYKEIFTSNDPVEIMERIALYTGEKVVPGKTLLFFDEIQECPNAILLLRYFYEELPALHVIGAGSLLEFALSSENFRMPVGRVQYMYLYPMSFGEFLDAIGEQNIREHVLVSDGLQKLPDGIHDKLNELLRKYFIIGGMPAVVSEYISKRDILKCQAIQHSLIETFIDDFAKYARGSKHKYLQKVFYAVPSLIGRKFVYSKVDSDMKSRDLKEAVELLEKAGIVHAVKRTSGAGLPLEAGVKSEFYKLLFLDIGLIHAISKLYTETAAQKDFTAIYNGSIAEQFVGQELLAYSHANTRQGLYYWAREAKSSNAEIDYLTTKRDEIIPIEVKAGAKGRFKSLLMFIEKFKSKTALKISQDKFHYIEPITGLPLYAIERFVRR